MDGTWSLSLARPPRILAMDPSSLQGANGVERFRIKDMWCLNLYDGDGLLTIDGRAYAFARGSASITAPGIDHEYRYRRPTRIVWTHFRPAAEAVASSIPVMQDLGGEYPRFRGALVHAAAEREPGRTQARVWDLLWELVERSAPSRPATGLVARARQLISTRLAEPLRPGAIAAELGVSHTHLNRRFRAEVGCPIGAWIRSQRLERARHLLRFSTKSISVIAREVGIPDIHFFNKSMRGYAGMPPRSVRRDG